MPKIAINGFVREMTAEETKAYELDQKTHGFNMAIENLRITRNSLLAKTDWSALSDNSMSDAMKTYRQQLRDATKGLDTVEKIQAYTFPTEVTK
tara:strand:+ start:22 stop:303 length:282 start_codon:yes stop_codon:yes gene_type:complete